MNDATKRKWKALREAAYEEGLASFATLREDPLFRDFLVVFLTEGHRRNKWAVCAINTNANMIELCKRVFEKISTKEVRYRVIHHEDRTPSKVQTFWSNRLSVPLEKIKLTSKKGNQLAGRNRICEFGTMHIHISDFTLREKVQAWSDSLEKEWIN